MPKQGAHKYLLLADDRIEGESKEVIVMAHYETGTWLLDQGSIVNTKLSWSVGLRTNWCFEK